MPTAALVSLVSFALQQFLQLIDPLFSRISGLHEDADKKTTAADAANNKKAVMGVFSVAIGLILVSLVDDLKVLTSNYHVLNTIVSAFVVGAGTEASNTVQKLLSYTKDKIKSS